METELDGVFAGGDAVLGAATAVEAIGQGRRAAEAIERYLQQGKSVRFPWNTPRSLDTPFDPAAEPSETTRCQTPKLLPMERKTCFDEVELALSAADARLEANRCLRCDYGKTLVSRDGEWSC